MRIPHLWFALPAAVALTAFACLALAIALRESLWIDELHTSWCVSGGSWRQIAARAAAGNQTPVYFWLVAVIQQTVGQQSELGLRALSAVAWFAAIALAVRVLWSEARRQANSLFLVGIMTWIVVDRLHWFYATEARPYALLQLVTLAGWCCVAALVPRNIEPQIPPRTFSELRWPIAAWALLAITSVYLHLTAVLPVACQWSVGCAVLWRQSGYAKQLKVWLASALAVALVCMPILSIAFPVWQRRTQWAAFASDVSLRSAITMFPILPVLGTVLGTMLIAVFIDRLLAGRRDRRAALQYPFATRAVWWSALLGPWLIAWLITSLEIAPVFHRRFVIASAFPLVVVGALELTRVRQAWLRGAAILIVAGAILFSQGSIEVWRKGFLVGQLRGEGWREAVAWLNERIEVDDQVLFSSGLIEATGVKPPLDAELAEYLAFPLNGLYQVRSASDDAVPIIALVADPQLWSEQILAAKEPETKQLWLIYRGAAGRLREKLKVLAPGLRSPSIHSFSRVHIVELPASLSNVATDAGSD